MSQDDLQNMLGNASSPMERFLILLARDLDGRRVLLERLETSDLDRVRGVLKGRSREDSSPELIKLDPETLNAYRRYDSTRVDKSPALFASSAGERRSEAQIRETVAKIAERSGVEFDQDNFSFRPRRPDAGQRIVSKGASRDLFYLYGIISHPIRRDIVELLGDEGPLGFSQIKKRLNIRVGTLYYHFDMLAGVITQGPDKEYMLTDAGRDVYAKLHSQEYARSGDAISKSLPAPVSPIDKVGRIFVPRRLISTIQSGSPISILGAALILGVGMFLVYQARLESMVLLLNPSNLGLYLTPEQESLVLETSFLASWLAIYAVSDTIATLLFGRRGEHLVLLLGTCYSLIPLLLFAGWWGIVTGVSLPGGVPALVVSRIVLILLQAWSLGILATIVAKVKGLRLDKSAVVALAVAYLSILIAYVLGA